MSSFPSRTIRLVSFVALVALAVGSSGWGSTGTSDDQRVGGKGSRGGPALNQTSVEGPGGPTFRRLVAHGRPADLSLGRQLEVGRSAAGSKRIVHTPAGPVDWDAIDGVLSLDRGARGDVRTILRTRGAGALAEQDTYMVRVEGGAAAAEELSKRAAVVGALGPSTLLVQATRAQAAELGQKHEMRRYAADLKMGVVGSAPMWQARLAQSRQYWVDVTLLRGAGVEKFLRSLGPQAEVLGAYALPETDGRTRVQLRTESRGLLVDLANRPEVHSIRDTRLAVEQMNAMIPSVVMTGHFNRRAVPFWDAGVDGGGCATGASGCPAGGVGPQFVGVSDDGLSTDTFQFSNTLTNPDLNPANDTDASQRPDVGPAWDPLESTCRHASLSIL